MGFNKPAKLLPQLVFSFTHQVYMPFNFHSQSKSVTVFTKMDTTFTVAGAITGTTLGEG